MSIGLSSISTSPFIWLALIVIAVIVIYVIVRFFFQHILKFLVQGCLVLLVIAALLALLHYFKVF
jgi:ABC-type bacteriocin/lantibiotic exporter with double-glycine peptidase domain